MNAIFLAALVSMNPILCSDEDETKTLVKQFENEKDELRRLKVIKDLKSIGLEKVSVQEALINIYSLKSMSHEMRRRLIDVLDEIDLECSKCVIYLVDHTGLAEYELPAIKKYARIASAKKLSLRALAIYINKSRQALDSVDVNAVDCINIESALDNFNKYLAKLEGKEPVVYAGLAYFQLRYMIASVLYVQNNIDDAKVAEFYIQSLRSKSKQVVYTAIYCLNLQFKKLNDAKTKASIVEAVVKYLCSALPSNSNDALELAIQFLVDSDYSTKDRNVITKLNMLTKPAFALAIREKAAALTQQIEIINRK